MSNPLEIANFTSGAKIWQLFFFSFFYIFICLVFLSAYQVELKMVYLQVLKYEHNEFAPMLDKTVDAPWPKAVQTDKFTFSKGTWCIPYYAKRCCGKRC